jgi:RNA recognition motif-containing protein
VSAPRSVRLSIRNLAWAVTEADLEALFGRFGRVHRILICTDPITDRPRGFGYVAFHYAVDVELDDVIAATTGQRLRGRAITVERARPRAGG